MGGTVDSNDMKYPLRVGQVVPTEGNVGKENENDCTSTMVTRGSEQQQGVLNDICAGRFILSGSKILSKIVNDSQAGKAFEDVYSKDKEDVLGEGGFATVFRSQHQSNKFHYAVKEIDHEEYEMSDGSNDLRREIAVMKSLRASPSPYLVYLFDVFYQPNNNCTYLVMEEMQGGDLLDRLATKEGGRYQESEARVVLRSLLMAVQYMHKKGIVHRDIKGENILLSSRDDDTNIKLCDFGCACPTTWAPYDNGKERRMQTMAGSPGYAAPEIYSSGSSGGYDNEDDEEKGQSEEKGYGKECDLWSVGVVAYLLLCGYLPFESDNVYEVTEMVCKGDWYFDEREGKPWSLITAPPKELVTNLLQVDPKQRWTIQQSLNESKWLMTDKQRQKYDATLDHEQQDNTNPNQGTAQEQPTQTPDLVAETSSPSADNNREEETNETTSPTPRILASASNEYSLSAVVLVFIVPALGGFLFGYDIAATSFVLQALTASTTVTINPWTHVIATSGVWQGIVVSLSSLGAWLSSWYMFRLSSSNVTGQAIGRRTELRWGGLLYIIGASMEASAGYVRSNKTYGSNTITVGLWIFLLGRLVYGLGIGITMHAAPTYIAEMSPTSIRGLLVSLKEASIVLGMVAGYVNGDLAIGGDNQGTEDWPMIYIKTLFFSTIMWLLAKFLIPESARFLLLQDSASYEQQALKSLEFVFPTGTTAREQLQEILSSLRQEAEVQAATGMSPSVEEQDGVGAVASTFTMSIMWKNRLPLTAGLGLVLLQQVTGQPSVLSYATQILQEAGLSGSAAIPIALFKLMATTVAASTVETFGRVQLLMTGCSLMLVALVVLTMSFSTYLAGEIPKIATLLALFLYIGGYQVGFGPITWLMTSEVFPLAIRGQAVALAVQFNFLFNAIVQFGVPVLQNAIGLSWTFGIFALLDLFSLVFIRTYVPETKGLTLEEIEEYFARMQQARPVPQNDGLDMTEPLLLSTEGNEHPVV